MAATVPCRPVAVDEKLPIKMLNDRILVRLTAEGQFRTCLFALDETDLRSLLRADGGLDADDLDDRLAEAITRAVGTKWAGHRIGQVDFVRPGRSMSQIGG